MNAIQMSKVQAVVAGHIASALDRLDGETLAESRREATIFDITDKVLADLGVPAPADITEMTRAQEDFEESVIDLVDRELTAQLFARLQTS